MLVLRVGKSGGLIQHDDGSVFQDGPCQSNPLLFTAGEIYAFRSNYSIQALRQFFQNVTALRGVGGRQNFFSGSVRPGGPDIFQKAFLKQAGILKYKGHLLHQVFRVHFLDIGSANGNAAAVCVPKAGDQAGGCGLSAAGWPYQSRHLAGADRKRHILQSRPLRPRISKGHMVKGYGGVCRAFLYAGFFHGFLVENFIQTPHGFVCLHDRLAHIHDPVNHLAAGGSKQSVEDKVDKRRPHVPAGCQKQRRRDQQGEGAVDKCQETGLPHTAAHGVLAGQIAVIFDGGVKSLEGVDCLLEHLYHRDTPDILHRFAAHAFDFLLITMEKACVFAAHHQAHGQQGQCHGEQAQKPHFPVKEEEHDDGSDRRDDGSRQIGELMSQQILRESGVVVNEFSEPS